MSTIRRIILLSIVILFSISLQGCAGISIRDHTPGEMPFVIVRDLKSTDQFLFPESVEAVSNYAYEPGHRFLVEVQGHNGASVHDVWVTINGEEHLMSLDRPGLWVYEEPLDCVTEYEYSFRVLFSSPLGGKQEVITAPATVNVTGAGEVVFYSPSQEAHQGLGDQLVGGDPSPSLSFSADPDVDAGLEKWVVIHNLRDTVVVLYGIAVDEAQHEGDQFTLEGVPANAGGPQLPPGQSDQWVELQCGEALIFKVRWSAESDQALGMMGMKAHSTSGDTVFNQIVLLMGY